MANALQWLAQLSGPAKAAMGAAGAAAVGGAALAVSMQMSAPEARDDASLAVGHGIEVVGGEGGEEMIDIYLGVELAGLTPGATPIAGEPAVLQTMPDVPVRIFGVAATAHAGTRMRITVTPPQGMQMPDPGEPANEMPESGTGVVASGRLVAEPPTTLDAPVSSDGTFAVTYTPRSLGEHEVVALSANGEHRGETHFEVEDPSELIDELREEMEKEAVELIENLHALAEAVCARHEDLPPSPARDRLKTDCEELEDALTNDLPDRAPPEWLHAADHLADLGRMAPELRAATAPLVWDLRVWIHEARQANENAPRVLAELTKGNVVCDQLDVVINGFKFCGFYLSLLTTPGRFFVDWASTNVPPKLVGLIPDIGSRPALHGAIDVAWKGIMQFTPKLNKELQWKGLSKVDKVLGVQSMTFAVSDFVGTRIFELYCQEFKGPVTGRMAAAFDNGIGVWWTYEVDITGELTLRYPKDAGGEAIALTGELVGHATRFKSQDDAIRTLFPKLAPGLVIRYQKRIEPITMPSDPTDGWNPVSSAIADGGTAVKVLLSPASYRIPVRGELRGDTIRFEVLDAAVDFDHLKTHVTNVVGSVWTLIPQLVLYELPYAGARTIFFRGLNDQQAEFAVTRNGETMTIERTFTRERETATTSAAYNVSMKACNPACP
jgi:hypothetical protein